MSRLNWGKAKLEVLAVKQQILSLYLEGHTLSKIHSVLISTEKITAKKSAFYLHAKPFLKEIQDISTQNARPVFLGAETIASVDVTANHSQNPSPGTDITTQNTSSTTSNQVGGMNVKTEGKTHSVEPSGFKFDPNANKDTRGKYWGQED